MAAIEAVAAAALPIAGYPSCTNPLLCPKPIRLSPLTSNISKRAPILSKNFSPSSFVSTSKRVGFLLSSTVHEVEVEAEADKTQKPNIKRKLFVLNLPWAFTVADIKDLFAQCGNVTAVDITKQKNGRNRNFVFVTMASGEEAQAVVDKLDCREVSGRIIRVEFSRIFKKPLPSSQPKVPSGESKTRHKLYVSNLAWKVRSSHLREFFSSFNPISSRVIFSAPTGQSAGYGFVSFATKEEADAAISTLNGKELMDRPLRLKFSENKDDEYGGEKKQESEPEGQEET